MQNTKKGLEKLVLKKEILDKINESPVLQGEIAELLGLQITTLYRVKRTNHPKLTQASVLNHLKDVLDYASIDDLLEPCNENNTKSLKMQHAGSR